MTGDRHRPATWWIILILAVLITVVSIGGWVVQWWRSTDSGPAVPAATPVVEAGTVPIRFVTDPVNVDTTDAVSGVLTDLATYWSGAGGTALGKAVPGPTGPVNAVDPGATAFTGAAPGCVSSPGQVAGNAYFCPQDHSLLFDNTALVPLLLDHYGVPGLTAAWAHEYGHAVQTAVGPTADDRIADPERYPALLIELQADCYAGAFLAWLVEQSDTKVSLTAADLPAALAPLVEFHDPAELTPTDPTAHGSAMDRLRATVLGWTDGPTGCRDLELAAFHPVLGREGQRATTTPRVAAADVAAAIMSSLTAWGTTVGVSPPSQPILAADSAYGQFATATLTALDAWQSATAPDRGACLTGAWVHDLTEQPTAAGWGAWLSDADEAALAVVSRDNITTAEIVTFVTGYATGPAACLSVE